MPSPQKLAWFDPSAIETVLSRESEPDKAVIENIINKSLELEPLNQDEIVALLRVKKADERKYVIDAANKVKQKVYGDRIVLTAPLHVDNHCASDCLYCAFKASNNEVARKKLSLPEIREAGNKLLNQGHKRLVLVSGQTEKPDVPYLAGAIAALFRLYNSAGEIRRVNLDVGALKPGDYAPLKEAGAGTVNIYQETYHEGAYKLAHPAGPKSDFTARLQAPQEALENDMADVGLGLTLGLGPADFDILGLAAHAAFLADAYGAGSRTVNLHRVRPAPGCGWQPPYPMNDADFLYRVAVVRLAIPYTGILLTTREPAGIWKEACNAGCSQLLTGSMANPYESWNSAPGEKAPFPIAEETHLDEVARFLLEEAKHLPSFCTACPRLGRNGSEFISMVRNGDIRPLCGPNSLASFMEFLLNYATPYTRRLGESVLNEKLNKMDEQERGAAERLLQKVRSGRMDEFI